MKTKLGNVQDWQTLARQANWSAVKLAKQCNVCVRTLERHFLKTTGKTPKVWLNEQRQYQAQKSIQSGFSVKESAFQLGHEPPTQFSREFRKFWGYCPTNPIPGSPLFWRQNVVICSEMAENDCSFIL
ncbi:MAG: helix-turn-helix transcriptional regulator [Verrucomicrobiia bacterium]